MIKRSNKGVTLISLVITIVISLLLIVSISVSVTNVRETSDYYKIKNDIVALQKQVQLYYLQNGELPLKKKIKDGEFHTKILEYQEDRNPNDNDTYYVLYDGSNSNEYYGDLLPEMQIQSKASKYVINSKSLTVYSFKAFEIDGKKHYTASSDFSGGRFASEYYQDLGIIDLADIRMGLTTDTVINTNGEDKAYPSYAKLDSIITITLSTKDMEIYDANGEIVKNAQFSSFQKKPSVNSFRITITSLEDENTVYLDKKAATSIDYTLDEGQTCKINFDLSKYGLNTSNMTSRRKITFSYDNNYDFYYNMSNRIDYNIMINNYFKLNTIEFENNAEEIIIAATMNNSEGAAGFVSNIKNVSTEDKSGNSKKWEGKYTYTNIVTAPSGQKYVINDNGKDFYKAYTITLNLTSNPNNVPQNSVQIVYKIDGKSYTTSSDYTIDAIEGKTIGTSIQISGFNSKSPSYTMGKANRTENVTLDAIQYTFTLKSNTSGSALALSNTTRSSTFAASGSTSDQTRTVNAYIGDVINYNITKEYYRYNSNEIGKTSNMKGYTMGASNKNVTATLVQNIVSERTMTDAGAGNYIQLRTKGSALSKNRILETSGTFTFTKAYEKVKEVVAINRLVDISVVTTAQLKYVFNTSNIGINKDTGEFSTVTITTPVEYPQTIYSDTSTSLPTASIPNGTTVSVTKIQSYKLLSHSEMKIGFQVYYAQK